MKTCYDVEQAKKDLEEVNEEIAALQMAIDRTNLNTFTEIED